MFSGHHRLPENFFLHCFLPSFSSTRKYLCFSNNTRLHFQIKHFQSMPGNEFTEHKQALHVHGDKERTQERGG